MNDAADAVTKPTPPSKSAAAAAAKRQTSAAAAAAAGCSPKAASPKASGAGGLFSRAAAALQNWRNNPTPTQTYPANSVRGSAARRQQSADRPAVPADCRQQQDLRPIEVCADCGAHFDTVRCRA